MGWRLDRLLLRRFMELCGAEGLRPAEVVEEFMRRSIEVGSVSRALSLMVSHEPKVLLGRELKARALISGIKGAIKDRSFSGEEYEEYQRVLDLLPTLQDPELIEEIKALAQKANALLTGDQQSSAR